MNSFGKSFSKNASKAARHVIGEFTGERLETQKRKNHPQKNTSTMDFILGRTQPEPMNPIVEAMLQTSDTADQKKHVRTSKIDREMEYWRQRRSEEMRKWREKQDELMARKKEKEETFVAPPKSAKTGPQVQKPGEKKGMEQMRKRN